MAAADGKPLPFINVEDLKSLTLKSEILVFQSGRKLLLGLAEGDRGDIVRRQLIRRGTRVVLIPVL